VFIDVGGKHELVVVIKVDRDAEQRFALLGVARHIFSIDRCESTVSTAREKIRKGPPNENHNT
jgi:hypothetical protein